MEEPGKILLVEDDPYDVELTLSALAEWSERVGRPAKPPGMIA